MALHATPQEQSEIDSFPDAIAALAKYFRKNKDGKKRGGAYILRARVASDSCHKAKYVDVGLNACSIKEALKRAGELVSLCHFCGLVFRNRWIDADRIAAYFPLVDLSDDLGRGREEKEDSRFLGGNAGLPFLLRWTKELAPPRRHTAKADVA